jgi:hypothetical protein
MSSLSRLAVGGYDRKREMPRAKDSIHAQIPQLQQHPASLTPDMYRVV